MSTVGSKRDRHYARASKQRPYKHIAQNCSRRADTVYPKFTCMYCGKHVFDNRKDTRAYFKIRFPNEPYFRAYTCKQAPEGIVYWHYGHTRKVDEQ